MVGSRICGRPGELLLALFWLSAVASGDVVINEIHYDPADKTVAQEFIELYNNGATPVDLGGWFFADGIDYEFEPGTILSPDGFVVVAEDPDALAASLGFSNALGPYDGRLANEGELVTLRDARGEIQDEVNYGVGFPWPLESSGRGPSMELIHPSLDNDLGGSWRGAGEVSGPPVERRYFLEEADGNWRYRKGTSEASDPVGAWRRRDFVEDKTWATGQTPVGYGDDDDNTVLDDMRGAYTSVFLRRSFHVESLDDLPSFLILGAYVDDGAVVWINDNEVYRLNIPEGEVAFDDTSSRSREARWENLIMPNPASFLEVGENLLAVHAFNTSIGNTDFSIDLQLFTPGTEDLEEFVVLPSPGAPNTVLSSEAPPQIRQVNHEPRQPATGAPIAVTAKVTDPEGVLSVELHYQIVRPGAYIPAFLPLPHSQLLGRPLDPRPPNPEFEAPENWTTVAMVDDGSGGDLAAADGVFTAVIPAQLENRTLVRYRISAADTRRNRVTVPYADDRSLNFACFVYDGVPPYAASFRSVHPEGAGHVYSAELMGSLPTYILLTRAEDYTHCIAYSSAFHIPKSNERARDKFNWEGAFVYDGVVYDHIRYRLRQANDRYGGNGKRSMRIRFHRGSWVRARDNYGRRYKTRWRTINTGKMFDNKRVGNFGLTESINHLLWNVVEVPAPFIHTFHLRVVDSPDEAPEGNTGQYFGDFHGMFLAFEDYDPRYLDAHDLEDGNLYKLKDGIFNGNDLKRNQGRFAVTNDEDFQNIRRNLRPTQTDEWLDEHVNYDRWYPYHAVVEGIRHYDFVPADSHSKNRAWYFEPHERNPLGRLWTMPWDSDASWGPNWNSGIDYSKNAIFAGAGKPAFKQKYRNVLREFRDLIWTEEVIHRMIDDLAAVVGEFAMADRDRWRAAPAQAGTQDFGAMEAKVVDMKRFAFVGWSGGSGPTVPAGGRASHLDRLAAAEGDGVRIPETPVVMSLAPEGFPIDALTFMASPFADPQKEDSFAAMKWRLGEVDPPAVVFDRLRPRVYEWPAVWEQESATFEERITVPPSVVAPGRTYRVRLKMMDDTGRWSHWSDAVEFTAGEPLGALAQVESLRITEIMYHPLSDEGFEFIELKNIGSGTLDLGDVSFRDGVEFSFAGSAVTSLGPGEYVVVAGNLQVFARRYNLGRIRVAGEYSGRLSNAGERLELTYGKDHVILAFEYDDAWLPVTDGGGFSLVVSDETTPRENWGLPGTWRRSIRVNGSPGADDTGVLEGRQLPGDLTQDARLNISDAVALLQHVSRGLRRPLPCGSGSVEDPANETLLEINGDRQVNLTDGVYLLQYLFKSGPPPAAGTGCVAMPDCPDACAS